jgi:hypothetical protein
MLEFRGKPHFTGESRVSADCSSPLDKHSVSMMRKWTRAHHGLDKRVDSSSHVLCIAEAYLTHTPVVSSISSWWLLSPWNVWKKQLRNPYVAREVERNSQRLLIRQSARFEPLDGFQLSLPFFCFTRGLAWTLGHEWHSLACRSLLFRLKEARSGRVLLEQSSILAN